MTSKRKGFDREEVVATKADLPELDETMSVEDAKRAADLITEVGEIKWELNKENEGSLAARYEEIKEELTALQIANDLSGMRFGKLVFTARLQDGRESYPMKDLVKALLGRGVKSELINDVMLEIRKVGQAFWVRELEELDC